MMIQNCRSGNGDFENQKDLALQKEGLKFNQKEQLKLNPFQNRLLPIRNNSFRDKTKNGAKLAPFFFNPIIDRIWLVASFVSTYGHNLLIFNADY